MGRESKIILLIELVQLGALFYVWYNYADRLENLVTRAETVSGKLETAGL